MKEMESTEEIKANPKKKFSFLKSVTKLLTGSSKTKTQLKKDIKEESNQLIQDHENPKLVDMDIIKTSAKEYDPGNESLPNSEQIKAKLIAVDKYYGFDKKTNILKETPKGFSQWTAEKEKERPSWGYIMERPLLEQYVLMNNYIRKASVLAELENIEEEQKSGKYVDLKAYETDTDISLPSDYETELRHYKKFSMMKGSSNDNENLPEQLSTNSRNIFKENRRRKIMNVAKTPLKNRDSSSIKSEKSKRVTFGDLIKPKKESLQKEMEIASFPSDSDPPTCYKYLPPELIISGKNFKELEHVALSKERKSPKKSDSSGIEKFATKFGIIRERRPSHPCPINEDEDDDDDDDESDSSDDSAHVAGSAPRHSKLTPILNRAKEKQVSCGEESSPAYEKPLLPKEENNQRNASDVEPHGHFQSNDKQGQTNDRSNTNSPDVEQTGSNQKEDFSPKNFISPIEVVRIQAEEMKKENKKKDYELNDLLAKSLTGKKKFNVPLKNLIESKSEQNKGKKRETMFSLIKDFGKFEPIPSTSTFPNESNDKKSSEAQDTNVKVNLPAKLSANKSVEQQTEDENFGGVKHQKGIEKYVEDLKLNGLDQISLIRKTPSMEMVEAEKRKRITQIIEEKNQSFQKSLSLERKEFSNEIIDSRKRSQSMELDVIKTNNPELEAGKRSQSLDIHQQLNLNLKNVNHSEFSIKNNVPLARKNSQLNVIKNFKNEVFLNSESDESDSSLDNSDNESWLVPVDNQNYTKGTRNSNTESNTDNEKNPERTGLPVNDRSFLFRDSDIKRNFSAVRTKPPEFINEMDERKTSIVERSQAIFDGNRIRHFNQDSRKKTAEEKYNKLMKHPYLDLVPDERKKQLSLRVDDKLGLVVDEFSQEMRRKSPEDKRRKPQIPKQ